MTKLSRAEQELKDFDQVFKALAHPTRRYILTVLLATADRMSAGDIVQNFAHKWPTITRHMKQLEDADLVRSVKEGTQHIYFLNRERMRTVLENWMKWF